MLGISYIATAAMASSLDSGLYILSFESIRCRILCIAVCCVALHRVYCTSLASDFSVGLYAENSAYSIADSTKVK